jgi:hypothetical protein
MNKEFHLKLGAANQMPTNIQQVAEVVRKVPKKSFKNRDLPNLKY